MGRKFDSAVEIAMQQLIETHVAIKEADSEPKRSVNWASGFKQDLVADRLDVCGTKPNKPSNHAGTPSCALAVLPSIWPCDILEGNRQRM